MEGKKWMVLLILVVLYAITGCSAVTVFIDPQPVVEFTRSDYDDPANIVEGNVRLYLPDPSQSGSGDGLKLLFSQAPILVQGTQPEGKEKYEQEADWIGHPIMLVDSEKGHSLTIDTQQPTLFCRIEKALVHGKELTQLVYVYWYPRHPVGGIQKGHIDGGIFRVTLDAGSRPSVYEHCMTCGCYHGVFIGEHVEVWAQRSFEQLEKNKRRYVEKKVRHGINWVVRDVVPETQTGARPVLFLTAGSHRCAAIHTRHIIERWRDLPKQTYQIKRYETLERLTVQREQGKTASMFNEDGLVWGGKRLGEEIVFFTMHHPGWPRHLDKVKMHWDEVDWTDQTLLDTYLRLPRQVVEEDARPVQ